MPIIPALGKWRQGNNSKLEASLVYTATLCLSGFYGGRSSLNNNDKKKKKKNNCDPGTWKVEAGGVQGHFSHVVSSRLASTA